MAVRLASQYFFGDAVLAQNTAGTLDGDKMASLQAIIISKFASKHSKEDQDALWAVCKVATGQKCKTLHALRKSKMAPK